MFCAAAFVVATVLQEFTRGTRARSRMAGEPPPVALVRLVRRNRRRYGGYIAHLGIALALVGVAASTSFQHSREAVLTPGQSVQEDGYTFTYVKPFASATPQKLNFGSVVRVTRDGRPVTTVRTVYGLYPSQTSAQPIGRFFSAAAGASNESRVGLDAGLTHDIWVDVAPNMTPLIPLINKGDREFARAIRAIGTAPRAQQTRELNEIFTLRDRLIGALTQRWVTRPWATQFKIIVSPLVTWLWLGAIITALGGLIALWPAPRRGRRGGERASGRGHREAQGAVLPQLPQKVGFVEIDADGAEFSRRRTLDFSRPRRRKKQSTHLVRSQPGKKRAFALHALVGEWSAGLQFTSKLRHERKPIRPESVQQARQFAKAGECCGVHVLSLRRRQLRRDLHVEPATLRRLANAFSFVLLTILARTSRSGASFGVSIHSSAAAANASRRVARHRRTKLDGRLPSASGSHRTALSNSRVRIVGRCGGDSRISAGAASASSLRRKVSAVERSVSDCRAKATFNVRTSCPRVCSQDCAVNWNR